MKAGSPLVSVLMGTRNERPEFLDAALRSVREQTLRDFEIVLIDDGTDNPETLSLLSRWREREPRLRVCAQAPAGLTAALRSGLGMCRAPLIARHDSDDWSEPTRLELQVAFMDAHPEVGMVGAQVAQHMANGQWLWNSRLPTDHGAIMRAFPSRNPFCHGSVMFRRSLALQLDGYREAFPCSQDYDFFWRFAEIARVANLPDILYHYRYSGKSVSAQRAAEQAHVAVLTRILARMRVAGREDYVAAAAEAEKELLRLDLRMLELRKRADGWLVGGEYMQAVRAAVALLAARPLAPASYASLARCAMFVLVPPTRPWLFRR